MALCLTGLVSLPGLQVTRNEKLIYTLFILFYVSSAVTFFNSENHAEAARKLVLKLPILLFPLVAIAFRNTSSLSRTRMVTIFSYAVFLPAIVSVYNYLINKKLFDQLILESKALPIEFGYGIYHIQFSILLASAVVFGCFSLLKSYNEKNTGAWFRFLAILTICNTIFIHLLSARTGLLAMYFGLLVLVISIVRKADRKFRIIAIAACLIIPSALFLSSTSLQNRLKNSIVDLKVVINKANANEYSFAMRVAGWKNGLDVIKRHPLAGVGIGDADSVLKKNFETFNPSIEPNNRRNPHNQTLETAVQSGLISAFLFLLVLAGLMIWKPENKNPVVIAMVLLLFISSNFESILERQASVIAFSVFLALAYYFQQEKAEAL